MLGSAFEHIEDEVTPALDARVTHQLMLEAASSITDIRLDIADPADSVIFELPDRKPARPDDLKMKWVELLVQEVRKVQGHYGSRSFSVICEGLRYRCQLIRENRYSLRMSLTESLTLEELQIPRGFREKLLARDLKHSGGLVLISGLPGQGKTTTLSSTIADRLRVLGGFALTIEDPIEMPLGGFHGDEGYCEQMSVEPGERFYDKIVNSLRCFPSGDASMLAVGEIRENDAAAELLRIAIDGHLVLATIHAKGPIEALMRILAMASHDGEENARQLLASSFKLVVHQAMVNNRPHLTGLEGNDKVRATIFNGNLEGLRDELHSTQIRITR